MAMKLQKVKIHSPTQFPGAQADEIRLAGQHSSFSPFLDIILPLS